MGIPKILSTFFIWNSPQINHFFDCKGKEDMGTAKIFDFFFFVQKMGIPNFFYCFWHENWEFPVFILFFFLFYFFFTIFRIAIF